MSKEIIGGADAYDKIDRYLRSNLSDEDYAEYSKALDAVAGCDSYALLSVALAMREWIDALPAEVLQLPAMPGFDRDWADEVIQKTRDAK